MNQRLLGTFICLLLAAPLSAEEGKAAAVVSIKRLTLESATAIAQGAIKACREKGVQIGVTVVDRNGLEQAVLRDTLAPVITLAISKGKAVAAVNFGVATSQLKERADTPIGRVPGLVMTTGGLPIQAGGNLFGAVGVSGAPAGETDAECAQAGINTVLDDLEMAP